MNAANARERTPLSDAVAATIVAERAAARLTQEAVYTKAGIGRSSYLRLESGERVADVSQLGRICYALELDLPTFFERAMPRVKKTLDTEDVPDLDRTPGRGRGAAREKRVLPAGRAELP